MSLSEQVPSEMSDRYGFIQVVGEGAMGQVHLVAEHSLQRQVALKTLHPDYMKDPTALGRFLNEVQITAQLDHPNIVPIYSLESMDDSLAYTMKLVKGKTLKDIFIEARRQWRETGTCAPELSLNARLDIFLKVCEAIHYAHSRGVIHRDLKPSNLMIGDYGEVYVMDWGIARLMGGQGAEALSESGLDAGIALSQEDMDLTQSGQILGTPRYMSPEQIKGNNNELDGRSDLFALGAILFECVTLKTAFQGKTATQLLTHILKGQIQPWTGEHPGQPMPAELRAIAYRALAVKRDQRYAGVKAFSEDIQRYLRNEPILARPDTSFQKVARVLSRHRQQVLLVGVLVVLISGAWSLGVFYLQQLEQQAAHLREHKITQMMELVAQRSRAMNMHFMHIESWTHELATLARYRLLQGQRLNEPIFVSQDFHPPDAQTSRRYGANTSTEWPIVVPAFGTQGQPYLGAIQQLQSLRPYFKRLLLRSGDQEHLLKEEAQRQAIQAQDLPVMWATIVLTDPDTAYWYPGKDVSATVYQNNFSPTHRPYYLIAVDDQGVQWGEPYIDGTSDNVLFPSALAFYSPQQTLLGTVSLDTQPEQFLKHQMNFVQQPAVQQVFLSNRQGEVIVQGQRDASGAFQNRPAREAMLIPQKEVQQALQTPKTGYQVHDNALWIYYYLPTPDWFLVVKADLQTLMESTEL